MGSEIVVVRKCMGGDCDNDAGSLQCPTCLKLGVKDSYFCAQDCFKRNWVSANSLLIIFAASAGMQELVAAREGCSCFPLYHFGTNTLQSTHKALHKSQSNFLHTFIAPKVVSEPDPDTGLYNPYPTFPFTGPLRPVYPLSPPRSVPKSIPYPDYALDGIPKSERVFGVRNKIEILDKKGQEGMRKVCRLAREVLDIAAAAAKPGVTTDYIDEIVHKACVERNVSLECFEGLQLTIAVLPLST
jgi:methionyl aminopeptidase